MTEQNTKEHTNASEEFSALAEKCDFDIKPYGNLDIKNGGFKKLDIGDNAKQFASQLLALVPTALPAGMLANAYVVKFPAGLPHTLMQLKAGGLATPLRGADGRFVGSAALRPVNTAGISAALAVFSVMSVATGQYFLTSINNKMRLINKKLDDIIDFLYGEKRSELLSEVDFVQYALRNYTTIMPNEYQRISVLVNLQEAKKTAMKDIDFYITDLSKKTSEGVSSYEALKEICEGAIEEKQSLELSLQLYTMASISEVYYSENFDPEYVGYVKDTALGYISKCEKTISREFGKLHGRNNEFKPAVSLPFAPAIDRSDMGKKLSDIMQELYDREKSPLAEAVTSALDPANKPTEYYLTKSGDVYVKETT